MLVSVHGEAGDKPGAVCLVPLPPPRMEPKWVALAGLPRGSMWAPSKLGAGAAPARPLPEALGPLVWLGRMVPPPDATGNDMSSKNCHVVDYLKVLNFTQSSRGPEMQSTLLHFDCTMTCQEVHSAGRRNITLQEDSVNMATTTAGHITSFVFFPFHKLRSARC